MSTTSAKPNQLVFLDGLRGIAAVYVMIGHARWLLWEGYSEGYLKHPEQYGVFKKLLMYFFSCFTYGHEAVLFFFVLSGFVIHLRYARNMNRTGDPDFQFGSYLFKRLKRIYPPFIVAILLTLSLDSIGRSLGYTIYTGTTNYALINENVGNADHSVSTFFGNLFFLYKIYFPVFGTNGPAWSLKYEWWFYMLYPIFLFIGKKKIVYPTLLLLALFVASFFPQYWPERLLQDVFSMMITWWFGVLLAEIYAGRIRTKFIYLAPLVLCIAFSPYLKNISSVLHDLNMAIFFVGLLAIFFSLRPGNLVLRATEKLKPVGDFSYTLYIVHFPILVLISGWLMQKNSGLLPSGFLYVIAGIVITTIVAYLLHFITEVPFLQKKKIVAGNPSLTQVKA